MINKTATWFSITLAWAFLLKYLYAVSDTSQLGVILWPTANIVGFFINAAPRAVDAGFFFPHLNVLIDKSCSGVNFFIIACCVFSSTAPYHLLKTRTAIALFGAIVVGCYGLTIMVNTSRIMGAILMLRAKPLAPWVASPWAHEAEGAFVYLFALLITYLIVKKFFIQLKNQYAQPAPPAVAFIR